MIYIPVCKVIFNLLCPPLSCAVGSLAADNLHLSVDRPSEGLSAGCQEHPRVRVLEHHVLVALPEVAVTDDLPHVASIADPSLAEGGHLLLVRQWAEEEGEVRIAQ